jgi:hypothetical protein
MCRHTAVGSEQYRSRRRVRTIPVSLQRSRFGTKYDEALTSEHNTPLRSLRNKMTKQFAVSRLKPSQSTMASPRERLGHTALNCVSGLPYSSHLESVRHYATQDEPKAFSGWVRVSRRGKRPERVQNRLQSRKEIRETELLPGFRPLMHRPPSKIVMYDTGQGTTREPKF